MRTLNKDFAVSADNDGKRNMNFSSIPSSYSYNYNNNNIPYHARENSLPFSYGEIGKTSTPLKSVVNNVDTSGHRSDNIGGAYRDMSDNYRKTGNEIYTNSSMNKPRPLLSPVLVRKTLNGNSPTHLTNHQSAGELNGNAKTISSSHYLNANGTHGAGHLSPTPKRDLMNNNLYSSTARNRISTRNDFEELLRDRRERVYNEYRETSTRQNDNLVLPPHQFRSNDAVDAIYATPNHRKYNYDFEFHLDLDEDWLQSPTSGKIPPQPPVRHASSSKMEQYTNNSNTFGKREQLQRELFRTRDIEFQTPQDVQRNYQTFSNSPSTYIRDRELEQRRQQTQSLPQPQRQQLQPKSIQQHQRVEYTTTAAYGNENAAGYDYRSNSDNYHNNFSNNSNFVESNVVYRSSLNSAPPTTLPPIYATSKKQVAKSAAYNNQPQSSPHGMSSPSTPLFSRPETPAFPVTPRTPFGTMQNGYSHNERRLHHSISNNSQQYNSEAIYQLASPRSRLNSSFSVATSNAEPQEVAAHLVKFAKDSSKFWYKPNMSRDDAISLLINAKPGTFVVRDSTTYKNAYGLVLRVAQLPPNTQVTGSKNELVRHFLIEPTTRGVRLKGCANEPVFTSLSALVYEHSINQLALPCLLSIPEEDLMPPLVEPTPAQKQLLTQGAACNVLWLYSCDTESLTGEEAIRKAIRQMYAQKPLPTATEVHLKVSQQGITLTDNTRKKFFRKHYAADMVSFCAIDPENRKWTIQDGINQESNKNLNDLKKTIFAFVARRSPSCKDNQCHVFCDLATNQPASAIISFANKTLPTEKQRNYVL